MLNIVEIQENFTTKSFEIFIAGCEGKCKGCHNPELWNYEIGHPYTGYTEQIRNFISTAEELDIGYKYIAILGGDLLDCKSEQHIKIFISWLSKTFTHLKLIVYTHHTFKEALKRLGNVAQLVEFIKCNPYDCTVTEYKTQYGFKILENQDFYKKGVDYCV